MSLRESGSRRVGYSLRARLYTAIGFLGLLPVLGVAFALVAMANSARDDAALDRAARGTIHLERINGLVYAVVMESRGIYMSPDWRTAEPFAKNLVRELPELRAAFCYRRWLVRCRRSGRGVRRRMRRKGIVEV